MTIRFHHLFVPDATDPDGFRLDFDRVYGDYFDSFFSPSSGLELWATFAFSPSQETGLPGDAKPWNNGSACPDNHPTADRWRCPTDRDIWKRLVRRALEFLDQEDVPLAAVEVWQEADRPAFFDGDVDDYIELLEATRETLDAFYGSSSPPPLWAPNSSFGGRRPAGKIWDFLESVLDEAVADPTLIDGVAVHSFSLDGYEQEAQQAVSFTKQAIADKGLSLPVAVTAASYMALEGTPSLCNFAELDTADQVRHFREMNACYATAGADQVFWYRSTDLDWTLCGADPTTFEFDALGWLTEIVDGGGLGDLPVPQPIYDEVPSLNLLP